MCPPLAVEKFFITPEPKKEKSLNQQILLTKTNFSAQNDPIQPPVPRTPSPLPHVNSPIALLNQKLTTAHSSTTLAAPTASAFQIIVSTPTLPTLGSDASFAPYYLTANGTVTSAKADGATFYNTDSQLLVSNVESPIGAAAGSLATQLKPYTGGGDVVSTSITIDDTSVISWTSEEFVTVGGESEASFWLRMDGTQSVWAIFGGVQTADAVPATLLAAYE